MKKVCVWIAAGVVVGMLGSMAHAQVSCAPAFANESLTPACPGSVRTIASFDDGTGAGERFFAGGSLSTLGGVAVLTGSGWQRAGNGLSGAVSALEVIDIATGPALFAGGDFTGGLATWDGAAWQPVTPGPGTGVTAVVRYDDQSGTGPAIFVMAGNLLKKQTAAGWTTVANINNGASDRAIQRVFVVDDLDPATHRAAIVMASGVTFGNLIGQGGIASTGIMRYDGQSVASLPASPFGSWTKSSAVFDDAVHGPCLFVSGHASGGQFTTTIARFDRASQAWAEVGPRVVNGFGDAAYGMSVFADGATTLPRLWGVGGTDIGINPFATVGAWDGAAWTSVSRAALTTPSSMGYHVPTHAGTLGPGHVPALLVAASWSSSTPMFAIVGCPRCAADVDLDGHTSANDLFMYLDAWFAHGRSADRNGNGLSVQDIFDYMNAWWAGC